MAQPKDQAGEPHREPATENNEDDKLRLARIKDFNDKRSELEELTRRLNAMQVKNNETVIRAKIATKLSEYYADMLGIYFSNVYVYFFVNL